MRFQSVGRRRVSGPAVRYHASGWRVGSFQAGRPAHDAITGKFLEDCSLARKSIGCRSRAHSADWCHAFCDAGHRSSLRGGIVRNLAGRTVVLCRDFCALPRRAGRILLPRFKSSQDWDRRSVTLTSALVARGGAVILILLSYLVALLASPPEFRLPIQIALLLQCSVAITEPVNTFSSWYLAQSNTCRLPCDGWLVSRCAW